MFIIEGNIGSGKSTLVRKLNGMSIHTLQEPVDMLTSFQDEHGVSIFEYYYKEPEKYAFSFQMHVLLTRFQSMQRAKRMNGPVVCERSIQTDKHIFAKCMLERNNMSDIEYKIFDTYYDHLSKEIGDANNDVIIYLRQEPTVCQDRIRNRSRIGEDVISLGYLKHLHDLHDEWLLNNDKVIVIQDNDDITVDYLLRNFLSKV
jgi:deoxyadenosine/deoxycytidine kinase